MQSAPLLRFSSASSSRKSTGFRNPSQVGLPLSHIYLKVWGRLTWGTISVARVTVLSRAFLVLELKVLPVGSPPVWDTQGGGSLQAVSLPYCSSNSLTWFSFLSQWHHVICQSPRILQFYIWKGSQHSVSPGWEGQNALALVMWLGWQGKIQNLASHPQFFPWVSRPLRATGYRRKGVWLPGLSQNSFWKTAAHGRKHPGRLEDVM